MTGTKQETKNYNINKKQLLFLMLSLCNFKYLWTFFQSNSQCVKQCILPHPSDACNSMPPKIFLLLHNKISSFINVVM